MTMFLRCLLVALVAAGTAARTDRTKKTAVQRAFEQYHLVPDLINVAPMYLMTLEHRSGASPELGNELHLWQVEDKPVISYPADCKSLYTLILFDPDNDEYSNDEREQCLHFLVVNIPGNQVSKGQIIADYISPELEKDSGYHRYTGLIYKQPEKIREINCYSMDDRYNFSLSEFVETYRLGNPIAGNLFRGRYEEDRVDADSN